MSEVDAKPSAEAANNPSSGQPAEVSLPTLSLLERRVLGVLVEKAKTTPDAYPLTLNALVAGCNQKSNRDPVLNLTEDDVEEVLDILQKKGLVMKLTGSSRVPRWRHFMYDSWLLGKVEMAILAELFLRGPQTEGELRGRASRMEEIADLETLRTLLRELGVKQFTQYLTPEGKRGTIVSHAFHSPNELEKLRAQYQGVASEPSSQVSPQGTGPAARSEASASVPARSAPGWEASLQATNQTVQETQQSLAQLQADLHTLKQQVPTLQQQLAQLADEFHKLKTSLGA